ncbi:hypothetical protein CPB86DRAFT_788148 [Serendipita vermifera]|nr:hypothetical protein CPB86DRAFT_788148 [Serendipita vermifera]
MPLLLVFRLVYAQLLLAAIVSPMESVAATAASNMQGGGQRKHILSPKNISDLPYSIQSSRGAYGLIYPSQSSPLSDASFTE